MQRMGITPRMFGTIARLTKGELRVISAMHNAIHLDMCIDVLWGDTATDEVL